MAAAETARLLAELNLGGNFNREADKAIGKVGKMEGAFSRIGGHAQRGLRNAATNIGRLGIVAGGAIGLAVKTGLDDLAALEDATSSVEGAINQVGLSGRLTAGQVATWANEIETAIGAAFDDKEIVAATSGLIRYGKVTEANLRPAMEVMTDLAARVGSVDTAGELLAKALADPTRAAGKLSRYGIILTKQQQKQIKAMAEAGDVAGAQALILDELSKSTKGAAEASQGPYRRAISVLSDVSEDARKAIATGFLPVIQKVADLLSSELAKPSTMRGLREFGETLAGGLDDLIDIARGLPWGTIGESLKIAGAGAKAVLTAFSSLPPWVQTAVATSWGLNKLTGGALGSIVGELGKGLIKGVLGMNAGVVNIRAGAVTGGGLGPGAAGGAVGGASKLATAVRVLGTVTLAAGSIIAIKELLEIRGAQEQQNREQTAGLKRQGAEFTRNASVEEMKRALKGIEEYDRRLLSELTPEAIAYQMNIDGVRTTVQGEMQRLRQAIASETAGHAGYVTAAAGRQILATQRASDRQYTAAERIRTGVVTSEQQTRSTLATSLQQVRATIAIGTATAAAQGVASRVAIASGAIRQATAAHAAASRIVSAIERNRPVISTTTIHNTQVVNQRQTKQGDRHV